MHADLDKQNLNGLSALYVEDMLQAGTKAFREKCRKTEHGFDTEIKNYLPTELTGFNVDGPSNSELAFNQDKYLRKIDNLPNDADYSRFRFMYMKLDRLADTLSDVLFEISTFAQVSEIQF